MNAFRDDQARFIAVLLAVAVAGAGWILFPALMGLLFLAALLVAFWLTLKAIYLFCKKLCKGELG